MNRKYNGADIVMLVSSGTLCENFTLNAEPFIIERPQWTPPYIENYEKHINDVLKKYLGINSHTQVKEATQLVNRIQKQAVNDLGLFKAQLVSDFSSDKERKNFLYATLGFAKLWRKAQNKNQTAMIELLFTFRNNLTPELQSEITTKGVNPVRITAVLAHAETLKNANITQESLKGKAKVQTEEAITEFNRIHKQAMEICTIGKQLFKQDKNRKQLFNFDALRRAQIAAGVGSDTALKTKAKTSKPKKKPKNKKYKKKPLQ